MPKKALANEVNRLFDLYNVHYSTLVASGKPENLKDTDLLVTSLAFSITYGDIKTALKTSESNNAMVDILAQSVEHELLAAAGKSAGLDKEKRFKDDQADFDKNLSIALLREKLEGKYTPKQAELDSFINRNKYLRYKPRKAIVLMIVTKTEEDIEKIRKAALKGGNFYELAQENSIAPNAKINAGRIGPLVIGDRPYNSVDKAILALKPGGITKPLKGDKGYSIFKLLEIQPREIQDAPDIKEQAIKTIIGSKMAKHMDKLHNEMKVETYLIPGLLPEEPSPNQ